MKALTLLLVMQAGGAGLARAQRHWTDTTQVASLQVVAGTRWQDMPVIRLGSDETINIGFDNLSHEYHRYTYSVVHLDADFTESTGLFVSDYLSGFQNDTEIETYAQSEGTLQLYTHYSISLPNEYCNFLMSGNYRLDVTDDMTGERVVAAYFMVSEDKVPVSLTYRTDTDIDVRHSHQQVELTVDYSTLRPSDPRSQLKGYVVQNGRWDNAVELPKPEYVTGSRMQWIHSRPLIFPASNEFHKFEILDVHRNSLRVESNVWDGEEWHTFLWPNEPRRSYVYDETGRGAFYIRNSDNYYNDTQSEYVKVHFALQTPPLPGIRLYVGGLWTAYRFLPRYEMHYDAERAIYEAVVPLKYGYYSYQYLALPEDEVADDTTSDDDGDELKLRDGVNLSTPIIPATEGSFYETSNRYNALIYYRGNTDRADRLVGVY